MLCNERRRVEMTVSPGGVGGGERSPCEGLEMEERTSNLRRYFVREMQENGYLNEHVLQL